MHSAKRLYFSASSAISLTVWLKLWPMRHVQICCMGHSGRMQKTLTSKEPLFALLGIFILLAWYVDMRARAIEAMLDNGHRNHTLMMAEQKDRNLGPWWHWEASTKDYVPPDVSYMKNEQNPVFLNWCGFGFYIMCSKIWSYLIELVISLKMMLIFIWWLCEILTSWVLSELVYLR